MLLSLEFVVNQNINNSYSRKKTKYNIKTIIMSN